MRPADQLAAFVRDALASGRSREEIAAALRDAGWAPTEISDALDTWAAVDFSPPVPRPRAYVSPAEAFFYALMFVALGVTAWHVTDLGIEMVNRFVPDVRDPQAYQWSVRSVRWSIASILVFCPVFLVLNRREAAQVASDPSRRRSGVRKWLGYLALFLASLTWLGVALATIYAFLNGELTIRFVLKAVVVALVASAVFAYLRALLKE